MNGSTTPGTAYSQVATGLIVGQEYQLSAFYVDLDGGFQAPNQTAQIALRIFDQTNTTQIAENDLGFIPNDGQWRQGILRFVAPTTAVTFRVDNASPIALGNDVGIDHIRFSRVSRQELQFTERGEQIAVEIVKRVNTDGTINDLRVYSADGTTQFALPDPNGRLLTTGSCNRNVQRVAVEPNGAITIDDEVIVLCDDNAGTVTTFLRRFSVAGDGVRSITDLTLDGLPYTPGGTVGACAVELTQAATNSRSDEVVVLCDVDPGGQVTRFMRRVSNDGLGNITIIDTTLDGQTAYVAGAGGNTVAACGGVMVSESVEPGCAAGVPWTRRRNVFRNVDDGSTVAVAVGYFDSANNEQGTAPAGFTLGACPAAATAATAATATIDRAELTTNGTAAAGLQSATFVNVGTTDATVSGTTLSPGEAVTWSAFLDPVTNEYNRLPAIAYTASATAILHLSTIT